MKKGFAPTPPPEKKMKNLQAALRRTTNEFKNVLRNPIVIAANLDKKQSDSVE